MVLTRLKYCLSSALTLVTVSAFCQVGNQSNQAVVTIVGNAPADNYSNTNDFVNTNPYAENNTAPQIQQQLTAKNNSIEPSLENGFHMRFEVSSQQAVEPTIIAGFNSPPSSSSSSGGASYSSSGKSKRHTISLAEHSFNTKKKIRSVIPKHKKKYHPHLCGRF